MHLNETTFLMLPCTACKAEVLSAMQLIDDELVPTCVVCDAKLPVGENKGRWIDAETLSTLGYLTPTLTTNKGKKGCSKGQCGIAQPAGSQNGFTLT
jgi:hypothetical protein